MATNGQTILVNLKRPNLSQHHLNADSADVSFECSVGPKVDDVDFKTVKVSVPAHKIILVSVSSVFQAMFYGQLPEKNSIEMTDVTAGGLQQFLHLFYNNEIICTVDHVHEVLYLAEKYDVTDCLFDCSKFLMENGSEVFKTKNFLGCSPLVIRTLLQNHYLKSEGEALFQACIDWAEHACRSKNLSCEIENIRNVLGSSLNSIDFASVKQSAAIKYLKKYHCLFDELILGRILQIITEKVSVSTECNPKMTWPLYLSRTCDTLVLKKGLPYRMVCETFESFLLYGIGFYFAHGANDKISLLVSVEKTENPDDQEKTKIFVGRLSLQNEFKEDGVIFSSSSLPDILFIQPKRNYIIEVTPFENVTVLRCANEMCYSPEDLDLPYEFSNEKFVVLRITKL